MRASSLFLAVALTACGQPLVDDYRESWAVIDGTVRSATGAPAANAVVHALPLMPAYAVGDTTLTDPSGHFEARIESFGVSSFRTDVRVKVSVADVVGVDTTFHDLFVAERGRARPDTLHVLLTLP